MKPLEIPLTGTASASLLARSIFYPRVPRALDWLALAAGVVAGLHLAIDEILSPAVR